MTSSDKKELELLQNQQGFKLGSWKDKKNFVDYFDSIVDQKIESGNTWKGTYNYLKNFTGGRIQFRHIDEKFCESFLSYLSEHVSEMSVNIYYTIFKTVLNQAVKDKIIETNPLVVSEQEFRKPRKNS